MALHVQISFLLAGEAGVGQILRRGAAPDGDVHRMKLIPAKRVVGGGDFLFEVARELGGENRVANLTAALTKVFNVAGVEFAEETANLVVELGFT